MYRVVTALVFTVLGVALHSLVTAPEPPQAAAAGSGLEAEVSRLLDDTLGPQAYRLYLVVDRCSTIRVQETLEVGDSVVVDEQSKKENYSKPVDPVREPGKKDQYELNVLSRNYLVGQTETTSYHTQTEIADIRCVVRVSETAWANVPNADSLLRALLDLPDDQQHRLSFQKGLDP